mgnify:CR=1 FL=1
MIIDKSIWNIDTLVLSSGGANGVTFFGAANLLKEYGILQNIKHYIGCSAGAITCALLACDIDPKEILEKYKIVEDTDVPEDRTFRDAWDFDFSNSERLWYFLYYQLVNLITIYCVCPKSKEELPF